MSKHLPIFGQDFLIKIGYYMGMDTEEWPVKMVTDWESLESMKHVGDTMGVRIEIIAKAGKRYSNRGGEGTSLVPKGCNYVSIHAGGKMRLFWDLVCKEKTKRRLAWLAAHPLVASSQ